IALPVLCGPFFGIRFFENKENLFLFNGWSQLPRESDDTRSKLGIMLGQKELDGWFYFRFFGNFPCCYGKMFQCFWWSLVGICRVAGGYFGSGWVMLERDGRRLIHFRHLSIHMGAYGTECDKYNCK